MSNDIMIITVVAITTFLTRVLPFIIFKDPKKTPNLIIYLSKVLPYSIKGSKREKTSEIDRCPTSNRNVSSKRVD